MLYFVTERLQMKPECFYTQNMDTFQSGNEVLFFYIIRFNTLAIRKRKAVPNKKIFHLFEI